jgi:hypothetical protein
MAASSICPPEYNLTREPCAVGRSLIIYQLANRYITILKIISLTSSVLTIFGVLVSRRRYMRLVCLFYRFFSIRHSINPPCVPSPLCSTSQPSSPAPFLCCLQFSFTLRIYSQQIPPILKMQQAMPTSAVVYVAC